MPRHISPSRRLNPREAKILFKEVRHTLEQIQLDVPQPVSSVVWPSHFDKTYLDDLSLSTRTRNCVDRANLVQKTGSLTIGDFLYIPNFGDECLKEIAQELELFLRLSIALGNYEKAKNLSSPSNTTPQNDGIYKSFAEMDSFHHKWSDFTKTLIPLFQAGLEFKGLSCFSSFLSDEVQDLASVLGLSEEVESVELERFLPDSTRLIDGIGANVMRVIDQLSESELFVLENRELKRPMKSLAELGAVLGLTRERIRQIHQRVINELLKAAGDQLHFAARLVQANLGPIVEEEEFISYIDKKLTKEDRYLLDLISILIAREIGYKLTSGVYISIEKANFIEELRNKKFELGDDAGLFDEQELLKLVPEEYQEHWDFLQSQIGVYKIHGCTGFKNTNKARVKAVLLSLDQPATIDEIASLSGLPRRVCASALGNLTSVVRATKSHWVIGKTGETGYRGIVDVITLRIEQDGGATQVDHLLSELPNKFGVGKSSVRTFLNSAKFAISNGMVSLADVGSVSLKPLQEVIHGTDENGDPYWTFRIESRHFAGFSVVGVPPEFAVALGCEPDNRTTVEIENLPNSRDLSLSWRLDSTTKATLGRVSDALVAIDGQTGDLIRVTMKGKNLVSVMDHQRLLKAEKQNING